LDKITGSQAIKDKRKDLIRQTNINLEKIEQNIKSIERQLQDQQDHSSSKF
jgi:hypothetical protein